MKQINIAVDAEDEMILNDMRTKYGTSFRESVRKGLKLLRKELLEVGDKNDTGETGVTRKLA